MKQYSSSRVHYKGSYRNCEMVMSLLVLLLAGFSARADTGSGSWSAIYSVHYGGSLIGELSREVQRDQEQYRFISRLTPYLISRLTSRFQQILEEQRMRKKVLKPQVLIIIIIHKNERANKKCGTQPHTDAP